MPFNGCGMCTDFTAFIPGHRTSLSTISLESLPLRLKEFIEQYRLLGYQITHGGVMQWSVSRVLDRIRT